MGNEAPMACLLARSLAAAAVAAACALWLLAYSALSDLPQRWLPASSCDELCLFEFA